jgi:hypothetical protein
MPLPTTNVTYSVQLANGQPDTGAVVRATLARYDVDPDHGHVEPIEVSVPADPLGTGTLTLWPNERGTTASYYNVVIEGTERTLRLKTNVPSIGPVDLMACSMLPEFPGKPDGQIAFDAALDQIRDYAAAAAAGADAYLADYAAVRAYAGTARSIYVTGYQVLAAPGKNAGWFTRDDSDTTTADNGGTVLVGVGGARWKRAFDGSVQIMWVIPPEEHDGIYAHTSNYDCQPAIQAAMRAVFAGAKYSTLTGFDDNNNPMSLTVGGTTFSGGEVSFPPGRFRCLSTVIVDRQVKLIGSSSGLPQGAGTILSFPSGVEGMIINSYDTYGLSTTVLDGVWPAEPLGGGQSIIQGLSLVADTYHYWEVEPDPIPSDNLFGYPKNHPVLRDAIRLDGVPVDEWQAGNDAAHGIRFRSQIVLRQVFIYGFEGCGVYGNNTFGIQTTLEHGNGNICRFEGVACYSNAAHGFFIEGGDSNACYGEAINVARNGLCGIYDSSFLGNTWIGCHANSNWAEQYKTDNPSCASIFIGCYSEASSGLPSSFSDSTIVVGGMHGDGIGPGTRFMQGGGAGVGTRLYPALETGYLSLGLNLVGDHDTPRDSGYVLRWLDTTTATGPAAYWQFVRELGRVKLARGSNGEYLSFYDQGCTTANGFARNYTDGPMSSFAQIGIGTHFFGTKSEMRFRGLSSSVPVSGVYLRGDIIWNSLPVAGGTVGWVCTTGGIAGSSAVFKTFGTIAA